MVIILNEELILKVRHSTYHGSFACRNDLTKEEIELLEDLNKSRNKIMGRDFVHILDDFPDDWFDDDGDEIDPEGRIDAE